ncbi:hypothetical protein ABPG74_018944 [Tetrahymena malaccensis]
MFNQQQCISSCDSVGRNFYYDLATNSCKCKQGYDFLVKNPTNNNFDCSKGYGFGYYCDSSNNCYECSQNCDKCSDKQTCLKCKEGSYLWQNQCFKNCFPNLNIYQNSDKGVCECPQGYLIQQLKEPIEGQNVMCQLPLLIQQINIYNHLMQSTDQELPANFVDNMIVFTYNRELTNEEYSSFTFLIDKESMSLGTDYEIIEAIQERSKIVFIVKSQQNRKVKDFTVTILEVTTNYRILNKVLVCREYTNTSSTFESSKEVTENLQSISQTFSSEGNGISSNIIQFLKQFQILGTISNFVQVMPLIYLIRDSLPEKVKFVALLGVSIVFNQTPQSSTATYEAEDIEVLTHRLLLKNTLKSLGIESNLYKIYKKQFYNLINIRQHGSRFLSQCNENCNCDKIKKSDQCGSCKKDFIYFEESKSCDKKSKCKAADGSKTVYQDVCCQNFCKTCKWDNPKGACKECTGPTDQDCKSCSQLYFQIQSQRCERCENKQYLKSSEQNCQVCEYKCIPCDQVGNSYSKLLTDEERNNYEKFCQVCSCKQCKSGYTMFNQQQCVSSCDSVGRNFDYDLATNSCKCQQGYDFLVKNPTNNNFDCSQGYGFGYYCDQSKNCYECSQNCDKCSDKQTCLKCKEGSFLWQNQCYKNCFPTLNIYSNQEKRVCECPQGYLIKQLKESIEGQNVMCQLPLLIQQINIYNHLMQSSDQELPDKFVDNMIVFTYNRQLTNEEYSSFTFFIDKESMSLGTDYEITEANQEGPKIVFTVKSQQNRKVKDFTVTILGVTTNYRILNKVLVCREYANTSSTFESSKEITENLQSISQTFSSEGNGVSSNIIQFLKQFQILGTISNFVQVMPLIYLIRDSLPEKVKFVALLGVSIVFNKTPQSSTATYEAEDIEVLTHRLLLKNTLKSLGENNCHSCKQGYFLQGTQCFKCNQACKECTGPTDQDCKSCSQSYFQIQSQRCERCENKQYLKSSEQNCQVCEYKCIPCDQVGNSYSKLLTEEEQNNYEKLCQVCSCKQCKSGYTMFSQQQCVSSCNIVGKNFYHDLATNSCKCQQGYDFLVKNPTNNNFDCSKGYGFGYYCDLSNNCYECSQNCDTCSDKETCLKCKEGSYLWQNYCYKNCFPNLNIYSNSEKGVCECPKGYLIKQLKESIEGQTVMCELPLLIQQINIYNHLMQSSDQELPSNFLDNMIVFTYNRQLTNEEYSSFTFFIDKENMNIGTDYEIIESIQEGSKIIFIVKSQQNRKVKDFTVTILGVTTNYRILNKILVCREYVNTSSTFESSKEITENLQSISQTFSSEGNGFTYNIIQFLKQFQILGTISNFVQVMPLIYLIRDSLPEKIKFIALLGVSIVFNQTPQSSLATYEVQDIEILTHRLLLKNTLQSLGIQSNLYKFQ